MTFWPYKYFIIESPLSAGNFSSRLLQHTEKNASGFYWFRNPGISFSGDVEAKGFSVIKTVPYWNLSPVRIVGRFVLDENPLVIKIKMYNSFTLPVLFLVLIVSAGLFYNYSDDPPWILFAGMFIVFYLILNIPFQIEAAKAKKILLEITQGKTAKRKI
jgi:hypothetical protein